MGWLKAHLNKNGFDLLGPFLLITQIGWPEIGKAGPFTSFTKSSPFSSIIFLIFVFSSVSSRLATPNSDAASSNRDLFIFGNEKQSLVPTKI